MSYEFKIVSVIFLTIPFIGLAAISFFHAANYTLYSSHTIEYAFYCLFQYVIRYFYLKKLIVSLPFCSQAYVLLYLNL